MPIYEYQCDLCSCRFEELLRSQADEVSMQCTRCGSDRVSRAMSVCGISSSTPSGRQSSGSGCSNCSSHNCGHCH